MYTQNILGRLRIPEGRGYVVMLSGGLDSSVLAYFLKQTGFTTKALTVNYGQRHSREQAAAREIATKLKIESIILPLQELAPILGGECSLLKEGPCVPEGHYQDDTMRSTVVPNRNMILLSLGVAWSISSGLDGVAFAAHAGDHAVYPDCRSEFADAMDSAFALCDYSHQRLVRPFVNLTKTDIVRIGASLEVPFGMTWSCYNGRTAHCGKCGTCVERIEAFNLAGVVDPTDYETNVQAVK